MMDDEECGAFLTRVVKAMDRLTRDEDEGPGMSGVALMANAKHHFALEDVEEFIAPVMRVGSRTHRSRRHSPFPHGAHAVGFRCRNLDGHTRSGRPDRNESSLSGCDNNRLHGSSSPETRRLPDAAT